MDIDKIEKKVDICQLNQIKNDPLHLLAVCHCNKYLDSHLRDSVDYHDSLDEFLTSREISTESSTTKNKKHKSFLYLRALIAKKNTTHLNEEEEKFCMS